MSKTSTYLSTDYWKQFPRNYRAQEMEILAKWIELGENGTVIGLSGTGRATLLDFLCHDPTVLQPYLLSDCRQIVLVPVDLINLPVYDLATLYRTILRAFFEIHDLFDRSTQLFVRDWYRNTQAEQDPFLSQSALRELLHYFRAREVKVGLVMNRFDRFCENASQQMTNTLRGLRDSFKETLFYIVSLPQEVIYLSHLDSIIPLRGILDTNVCWVGPLSESDARSMIVFRTRQLTELLPEQTIHRVYTLTGGLPSLIRVICDWWMTIENQPIDADLIDKLLTRQNVQHRLDEMWNGLTQEEQSILSELAQSQSSRSLKISKGDGKKKTTPMQLEKQDSEILQRLRMKGVCQLTSRGWCVTGSLLAVYAANRSRQGKGKIRLDKQTGEIYLGKVLLDNITPLGRAVLLFLIEQPYIRHTHTNLIEAAWPEDVVKEGVSTEALYQIIRSLRKEIEPDASIPRYLINWRGQMEGGYQFFPEGKPTI